MIIDSHILNNISTSAHVSTHQVKAVLDLMLQEECTIPFIVRYRKERTGGLDEVQIRQIYEGYEEYVEIEKRRAFILETLKKKELMTPELEKDLLHAVTLQHLEDLYAPFKSKKKTKAQVAKEKGLGPLADLLLISPLTLGEMEKQLTKEFVPGPDNDIATFAEALDYSCDILIERFAHHQIIKDHLRQSYWEEALIVSSKKEEADKIRDFHKYQDFFGHQEPIKSLKSPKASHRFFAMRRGQKGKILKVDIQHSAEFAYSLIQKEFFPETSGMDPAKLVLLNKCAEKAYLHYLHPSLDLEIKTELKKYADTAAIDVFSRNLKDLLLAPYLGSKTVMGVDPGIRTGCKIVVVDSTGKLVEDQVIYPFPPQNDVAGSKKVIEILLKHYSVQYVAIGNGTNGRETLAFFKENFEQIRNGEVKATLISEAGASIYSASDLAREEFPDKDPTVRGAISIARRFQDPLAELVKIDPKSIGVGQYQHDVNQTQMKKTLTTVVESCVNYVGVDINTASVSLLSFISGMSKALSKNLIQFREESGGIKSREELLKVPRFTDKIFQQCAGFLRIYGGANPLDATFIHPEHYEELIQWTQDRNFSLKQLVEDQALSEELKNDPKIRSKIGEMTLHDIIQSLKAPSQDPRKAFESVEFQQGLTRLEDVKEGQVVKGVVTNITMFGAFVDIGIKEQGLLHISELSNSFVQNTFDLLQIGQEIQVKVLSIDLSRRRLALSCKQPDSERSQYSGKERSQSSKDHQNHSAQDSLAAKKNYSKEGQGKKRDQQNHNPLNQRPFSILKNFKV